MPRHSPLSARPTLRLRREGVLRPGVLGIAPAQLLADLGIGALPEASQVVGDLLRAVVGGEQVQQDRDPSSGEIVAITPNATTQRRLALVWGVMPVLVGQYANTDQVVELVERALLDAKLAEDGDLLVLTAGIPLGGGGRTNFLKVHRLAF